jgi:hypothetical protein
MSTAIDAVTPIDETLTSSTGEQASGIWIQDSGMGPESTAGFHVEGDC